MSWKVCVLEGFRKSIRPGWRAKLSAGFIYSVLSAVRPRKQVALDNLKTAFPQSGEAWRNDMLKKIYSHFSWITVEYLAAQNDLNKVDDWFVECEGKEHLDELLAQGRGAVLLMAHLGNWELMGAWLVRQGYPVYAVVRDPDEPDLAALTVQYRENIGVHPIPKEGILKEPVRQLKKGNMVVVAGDQNWGRHGLQVPFFDKVCGTAGGPAAFGLLSGTPVVPVAAIRKGPFRYAMKILPPLEVPPEGKRDEKVLAMTTEANRVIEDLIRQTPEQWLWMHRRWRD